MRTTLNLDDDVYEFVRRYADARSQSVGNAVSELVRRGLEAPLRTRIVNGFHMVDIPSDTPPVTTEQVRRLLAETE
jgi:hypothetical protein